MGARAVAAAARAGGDRAGERVAPRAGGDRPAGPPALARGGAAGTASARGLLLTVLGELVLPAGGAAWTSAFIAAFARLGVGEKAIRQALARAGAAGWIRPERHGRRTRWVLTAGGTRLLTEGTERIYAFTGTQRDWDGSWMLVLAPVPDAGRPARRRLRTRLSWAGLGSPAPGVWITTHANRLAEVEDALRGAGIASWQAFAAEHRAGAGLAALVAQAWDLPAIEKRYEEFLAEFGSPAAADPLARLVELVHAWRRFPFIDPGLPGRLLPPGWIGMRAARLFTARHERWSPPAAAEWARLNGPAAVTDAGLRTPP